MSRLQNARVRALKATAGDLAEIVSIAGLTPQELFHLHEARRICLALMEAPINNQVKREHPPPATTTPAVRLPESATAQQGDADDSSALRRAFPNHGKPWCSDHTHQLKTSIRQAGDANLDMDALSHQFGRSPYSVALKASAMGYRDKAWADKFKINATPGQGPA